jgi:hypothetical protein
LQLSFIFGQRPVRVAGSTLAHQGVDWPATDSTVRAKIFSLQHR